MGGVCAGIALGAAGLGTIAPDLHHRLNVGAVAETEALRAFQRTREQDEAFLADSGVSEIAVTEAIARNDIKEAALEAEVQRELERFVAVPMAAASALGLVFLMLGTWANFAPSLAGARIGVAVGALAALAWAVVARKLLGLGVEESVACGAVIAGGTCWSRGRWRWSVGAGSVAAALVLLAVAGATRAAWTAALAVTLGALLSWTSPIGMHAKCRMAFVAHAILVPGAIAMAVSTCSVELSGVQLAFVVLAGVFAGDVHIIAGWLGIGWLGRGRRLDHPASAWLGVYDQGWAATSLVLMTAMFATGVLDPTSSEGGAVGLALAMHALSAELKRPPTHRLMGMMRREV